VRHTLRPLDALVGFRTLERLSHESHLLNGASAPQKLRFQGPLVAPPRTGRVLFKEQTMPRISSTSLKANNGAPSFESDVGKRSCHDEVPSRVQRPQATKNMKLLALCVLSGSNCFVMTQCVN
jgi:hypothetical protein